MTKDAILLCSLLVANIANETIFLRRNIHTHTQFQEIYARTAMIQFVIE